MPQTKDYYSLDGSQTILYNPFPSKSSVMCFRTIHNYQCCGKEEIYVHYPCPEARYKETCKNSRGPNLSRTTPCTTCLPQLRFETTLRQKKTLILQPEELRDNRRDRVAALQVLAEVVFAMHRGNSRSDQTLDSTLR